MIVIPPAFTKLTLLVGTL